MRIILVHLMLLMSCSVAQAGMILDGVSDSLYLQWANQFPSAGRVTSGGSGTLITPNLVLTAGHVGLGDFVIGGNTYTGVSITPHPQFVANGSNLNFGFDIAVLRLATPVTNVTPVPWYTGNAEIGTTMTMTGFGVTGVGSSATSSGGGILRAGTNVIDLIESFDNGAGGQIGAQNAIMIADFDAPVGFGSPPGRFNTIGSAIPTSLEYHLASGDSGGGVFLQENGVWYVAGVNSGISSQFDFTQRAGDNTQLLGYGAMSYVTRVSSFRSFIEIQAVPEPSSMLMSVLVITGAACFIRGRKSSRPSL
ncbi:MAG: trypsin-like serine protease [Pirellula sp.]